MLICAILSQDDDAAREIALWWAHAQPQWSAQTRAAISQQQVTSELRQARAVFYFGHGERDAWISHDGSVRFADTTTIGAAKDALVVAMACFSGDALGEAAISKGVRTYIGFTRKLYTVRSSPDLASAGASAVSVLLQGGTASQFTDAVRREFMRVHELYKNGIGRRLPDSTLLWVAAMRAANSVVLKGDPSVALR